MKNLGLIVAGLAALGLATGCDNKRTTIIAPAATPAPVIANYEGISANGQKVILEDHVNLGDLIAFDTQTNRTSLVLPAGSPTASRWIADTTDRKAAINEWDSQDNPSQSDFVVADLNGGPAFDTDTPDKDEYFLRMINTVNNDQTAIYQEWDNLNNIQKVLAVDVDTHQIQDMFGPERVNDVRRANDTLTVRTEDFTGLRKFYSIDENGKQLLFDTSANPGNFIHYLSTPEVVAHQDFQNFMFELLGTGGQATYVPTNPALSNYLQGLTSTEAIMSEFDGTTQTEKHYHFNFATQATTLLDLSAFPNWQGYFNDSMVSGTDKLALPGRGNVLFYNRANGTIEDLVTPIMGTTPDYAYVIADSNGKALINAEGEDANQNYVRKALYFDGTNLTEVGSTYSNLWTRGTSQDRKHVLIEGDWTDLLHFNVESNILNTINSGDSRDAQFSQDSSRVFYSSQDQATNEWVVEMYDVATGAKSEISRNASFSSIRDVSQDNSAVIIERDYSILSIDTVTGKETFVAYQ